MIPAGEAAPGPNEFPPRPLSFFTISSQLIIAPFLSVSRILIKLMTNAFLRVKAAGFNSMASSLEVSQRFGNTTNIADCLSIYFFNFTQ